MPFITEETKRELQERYSRGCEPVDLLRYLSSRGLTGGSLILAMRDVFGLRLSEAIAIGGWRPDGTGELTDERVNAHLGRGLREAVKRGLPSV